MRIVFVDTETYYDDDYSLRKMTVPEYVLDPRFECIGWAWAEEKGYPYWLTPEEFSEKLAELPEEVTMVSHNALFDMFVLKHRFNYTPKVMLDTLGMARALHPNLRSHSLAKLADHFHLPAKGGAIANVKGWTRAMIEADKKMFESFKDYARNDANLCRLLFQNELYPAFPPSEIPIMDTVLRMAVVPRFNVDTDALRVELQNVIAKKAMLLAATGMESRDQLMSNEKFAEVLRSLGVEPPKKVSPVTGKETYAFAKNDPAFAELAEHDDPRVQTLVAARLGAKSTLEETRLERLIKIGECDWGGAPRMPMPLKYSGAHTHRFSGDWKINVQNFPRGSALRRALIAPPGHKVVAVDASQIEARLLAALAGEDALVSQFAQKRDVYSEFASEVFGYPVSKRSHPVERFIGKTAVLGLGYGLGAVKFHTTVNMQARLQLGREIDFDLEMAQRTVNTYRRKFYRITDYWMRMNHHIDGALRQPGAFIIDGPLTFGFERIALPSGLGLVYSGLETSHELGSLRETFFTSRGNLSRLYGGKLTENIVQALARCAIMEAAMRVDNEIERMWPRLSRLTRDRDLFRLALQVHDELVYVVPEQFATVMLRLVINEMSLPPKWMPNVPLDAEGGIGGNYGECK